MKSMNILTGLVLMGIAAATAHADDASFGRAQRKFDVTITNLTAGVSFTPLLVATHSARTEIFRLGKPASDELATLAEGGDTQPLQMKLQQSGELLDAVATAGLLAPGASVTVRVQSRGRFDQLSIAGMLLPTNDGFVALNGIRLPWDWDADEYTYTLSAYDAGSEPNDERCASIPGPHCGGIGGSPGIGGEGFVHIHSGIHGIADLSAAKYDWRNPVALVTIKRAR
ncbi:MAG: spondin domain-containing protein [Steroidobacteraceae bacterium]